MYLLYFALIDGIISIAWQDAVLFVSSKHKLLGLHKVKRVMLKAHNEVLFLLSSYVVVGYGFGWVILSILKLGMCSSSSFQTVEGLVGSVQSPELRAHAPGLPRFILLLSFSGTLLVVSLQSCRGY